MERRAVQSRGIDSMGSVAQAVNFLDVQAPWAPFLSDAMGARLIDLAQRWRGARAHGDGCDCCRCAVVRYVVMREDCDGQAYQDSKRECG